MKYEDWKARWDQGQIGFHLGRPHPALERHIGLFAGAPSVLVPLAGKAVDLDRLAEVVPEVIANEFVEAAARAYFAERDVTPRAERRGTTTILRGGPITYLIDDFFSLELPPEERVAAVFDRAALVAVDPSERARYVDRLARLLRPGGVVLLIAFEFDQRRIGGPPFSIGGDEVHALFEPRFALERLEHLDAPAGDRFVNAGVPVLREAVYRITLR